MLSPLKVLQKLKAKVWTYLKYSAQIFNAYNTNLIPEMKFRLMNILIG